MITNQQRIVGSTWSCVFNTTNLSYIINPTSMFFHFIRIYRFIKCFFSNNQKLPPHSSLSFANSGLKCEVAWNVCRNACRDVAVAAGFEATSLSRRPEAKSRAARRKRRSSEEEGRRPMRETTWGKLWGFGVKEYKRTKCER